MQDDGTSEKQDHDFYILFIFLMTIFTIALVLLGMNMYNTYSIELFHENELPMEKRDYVLLNDANQDLE
jgi:hypothetical protein